ncbi:MAG: hypothetical protein A3G34_16190 [Candidatus Lindowbacteria bacterium RIFCSPLOWO2_12_FULL_62_27]|nr:MAG: hypothetical protein A3I06_17010 [Candidatus Lindowbacteria bacterium RIFCSPLOWO2_02_FULL_62_12]OGH59891.1 MAG: hypothetical protein A3G34_16190 [Candidatus Lindowbacteria bacterium RIFCSPLOWO2_12_FULL_62_27]
MFPLVPPSIVQSESPAPPAMPVSPAPLPTKDVAVTTPFTSSAVEGLVVPMPTRLFAASTYSVGESTFNVPSICKLSDVEVVPMATFPESL